MNVGWAAVAAAMLVAAPAAAQTYDNILAGLNDVELVIVDSIKDGCWREPKATLKEVELELVRSSLTVRVMTPVKLVLSTRGFELTRKDGSTVGHCAISVDLRLDDCTNYFPSYNRQKEKFECLTIWSRGALVLVDKPSSQREVTDSFVEFTRLLLLDLEKDRRGIAPE